MRSERERWLVTIVAGVGFLVALFHVLPPLNIPRAMPGSPRVELAREMQEYEMSVSYGLDVSLLAFHDVERHCHSERTDPVIDEACTLFDAALHNNVDRETIDEAVALLQQG